MFTFGRRRNDPIIVPFDETKPLCKHCGGYHDFACPRLLRERFFDADGTVLEVFYDAVISRELWPDVAFPEETDARP